MLRQSAHRSNTAGFTLIETLFSLAITLVIVSSVASIMQVVSMHHKIDVQFSQYEIAAKQIAQTLVTAKYQSFGKELKFIDENEKEFTIKMDKNRIVKTPGFDIYGHDVDEIYFTSDNHKVYMEIRVDGNSVQYLIGSDYYQDIKEEIDEELEQ